MSDEAINEAIALLRTHGYRVTAPERLGRWQPMGVAAAEAGLSVQGLAKRLNAPLCPPFDAKHHLSGRRSYIYVTDELAEFLRQPKQPGRRLAGAML